MGLTYTDRCSPHMIFFNVALWCTSGCYLFSLVAFLQYIKPDHLLNFYEITVFIYWHDLQAQGSLSFPAVSSVLWRMMTCLGPQDLLTMNLVANHTPGISIVKKNQHLCSLRTDTKYTICNTTPTFQSLKRHCRNYESHPLQCKSIIFKSSCFFIHKGNYMHSILIPFLSLLRENDKILK